MKTIALALATTSLTAAAAIAADISTVDQNGDRFASKTEVAAVYPTLTDVQFRDIDLNRDNRISSVEFNRGEARAIFGKNVDVVGGVQTIDALDTDGSNFVSEAELVAAYPGVLPIELHVIDTNGDNRVSAAELYDGDAQTILSRYDAGGSSVLVSLDVIDTDGSGFASLAELSTQYGNLDEADFLSVDSNRDGRISFAELYDGDAIAVLGSNR